MNPVLGYLVERPGLLATLGAAQRWRENQRSLTPPSDDSPYYRSADGTEAGLVPGQIGGFWSRVSLWAADHLVTHFAVATVLGAVAFGGLAVISLLSRLKFTSVWTLLVGLDLFLAYLVFVGGVIVLVDGVSKRALQGIQKNGRRFH